VSVSDHAVGIPSQELGKVLNKFYRGTQKRREHGGAGLGLAICRNKLSFYCKGKHSETEPL